MLKFVLVLMYETLKWHLLQLLICMALKFSRHFLPELLLFQNFFFTTGKWQTIKIMNLQHMTLICINYFVFIFQCILMYYYYFRLIRLLNASNCSIVTFYFNGFIHELFFLFKNASWYKYLARSKRACAFWEFYHGLIDFLFDYMLQMHSIKYLTTKNNVVFVIYGTFLR